MLPLSLGISTVDSEQVQDEFSFYMLISAFKNISSISTSDTKQDQDEFCLNMLIPAFKNVNSFLTANIKLDDDECCLDVPVPALKNINSFSIANGNFLESLILLRINKTINLCGTIILNSFVKINQY